VPSPPRLAGQRLLRCESIARARIPSSVSTALLNLPEQCTKRSVHSRPGIQREKPTRTRPPLQRTSDDRKAKTGKGTSVENDSWESVEIASVVAEANRKGHALVTVKGRVGCKGLRPQAMPFLLRRGLLVHVKEILQSRQGCSLGRLTEVHRSPVHLPWTRFWMRCRSTETLSMRDRRARCLAMRLLSIRPSLQRQLRYAHVPRRSRRWSRFPGGCQRDFHSIGT